MSPRLLRVAIIVLWVLGCVLLAFPPAATVINNYWAAQETQQLRRQMEQVPPVTASQIIADARRYNEVSPGEPILDPWLSKYTRGNNPKYQRYLNTLKFSSSSAFGYIQIPKIGMNLPIYHGSSDEVLGKGVGHLYGTSLPVGGKSSHAVLTGHNGLPERTIFDKTPELVPGDTIVLNIGPERLWYRVTGHKIVEPNDPSGLQVVEGKDLLTLLTCYPYAINTHRWETFAERFHPTTIEQETVDEQPTLLTELIRAPIWVKTMLLVALLAIAVPPLVMIMKKRKRSDSETPGQPSLKATAGNS